MKILKKFIAIFITVILFTSLYVTGSFIITPQTQNTLSGSITSPEKNTEGGTCGNNLTWSFSNGVLTIQGKGNMKNYNDMTAPWTPLHIVTVDICEGVTSIGSYAFSHKNSLQNVSLPSTLKKIGQNAFAGIKKLPNISVNRNNTSFASMNGILFNKKEPSLNLSVFYAKATVSSLFSLIKQVIIYISFLLYYH